MAWKSTDTAKLEMIHLDRIIGFIEGEDRRKRVEAFLAGALWSAYETGYSDGRHEEVERARAKTCANCCRQAQELSDAGICLGCLT